MEISVFNGVNEDILWVWHLILSFYTTGNPMNYKLSKSDAYSKSVFWNEIFSIPWLFRPLTWYSRIFLGLNESRMMREVVWWKFHVNRTSGTEDMDPDGFMSMPVHHGHTVFPNFRLEWRQLFSLVFKIENLSDSSAVFCNHLNLMYLIPTSIISRIWGGQIWPLWGAAAVCGSTSSRWYGNMKTISESDSSLVLV